LRLLLGRDGEVDEVADHRLDVAADVADLGELRGLDLDEGGAGEAGQPAGDLGLAHARRPDHDDVVGDDLLADVLGRVEAAPAVPQGDGDAPLRVVLPDDVLVEGGDDLAGREGAGRVRGGARVGGGGAGGGAGRGG